MPNKLANKLIQISRNETKVSDTIWRYYDFNEIVAPRTPISNDIALELSIFLEGDQLLNFGKIINNNDAIANILAENPSKGFCNGLAENPIISTINLQLIQNIYKISKVDERIVDKINLIDKLGYKDSETIKLVLEKKDAFLIAEIAKIDINVFNEIIFSINDDDLYFMIISQLDDIDKFYYDLLFSDIVNNRKKIDRSFASWLINSDSEYAKLSKIKILQSNYKREILPILSFDAYVVLSNHDDFRDFILSGVNKEKFIANSVNKLLLDSLLLTGSTSDEIVNLIFNSRILLDDTEFTSYINNCSLDRLVNYIMGNYNRTPSKSEIEIISNILEAASFDLSALYKDKENLSNLSWFRDLTLNLPGLFVELKKISDFELVDKILTDQLGSDDKAWDIFLAMSNEWSGSLKNLIGASAVL
jgi:hypothetical protein